MSPSNALPAVPAVPAVGRGGPPRRSTSRRPPSRRSLRRRAVRSGAAAAVLAGSLLAAVLVAPGTSRAAPAPLPFRDPDLPLATRVDDLVGRLTLPEKISLLHQYEPAIPRLGIPSFRTGTEALHGVAWLGDATVFPQAIGLGSTWDPALVQQVGAAVGQEARGFNAKDPAANGLNLWAPVVNLLRDPRWGRNEEGYSEDPLLTGAISTAYGKGIEGPDPAHLQAAPTLKHYLAYNNEVDRSTSSSVVPPRVLHDYDQQAFRPALQAGAATGVMASYNLVNGRPQTVDPTMAGLVRSWSPDRLMNVTDAGAPTSLTASEAYFATPAQAYAASIRAGMDSFTDNNDDSEPSDTAIAAAVQSGLLSVKDVEKADGDILSVRFRLGDFDPPGVNPYASITPAVIDSPAHRALARKAADAQVVLLKNGATAGNGPAALPMTGGPGKRIAVVGPLSDTLYTDWYSGTMPYRVTPLQGITERAGAGATVTSSEGVDRIALQDPTSGRYLTAGTAATGAALAASGTTAGAAQGFDVTDWGSGFVTLRATANQHFVTLGSGGSLVNSETQPNGWFVQQKFKLDVQPDGSTVLEYAGNDATESWFGPNHFALVAPDGSVRLGAATAAAATHFVSHTLVDGAAAAASAAAGADTAVVVVGSMPFINGREAGDRTTLALPARQEALIRAVRRVNPHTVVVLENSYPDSITWEQQHVPGILWTSHAGQETGHALADTLFGDVEPTGRVPQTWYRSDADLPATLLDYDIAKTGQTYQYFGGTPLYPFGFGLGYTTFRYSGLRFDRATLASTGSVKVSVDVTNTGRRAGTDVVQLYTRERVSRAQQPVRQLKAFSRVGVPAGATRTVTMTLSGKDLAFWDVTRSRSVVETGTYEVMVGPNSGDIRQSDALPVRGQVIPARNLLRTTPAQGFDDYAGTTLVDTSKASGTAVAAMAAGQWVSYRDAAFGTGVGSVTARVSRAAAGTASIQVRLGSPTGPVAATIPVPSTGNRYTWTSTPAAVAGLTGRKNVYLVFTGAAQLDSFAFARGPASLGTRPGAAAPGDPAAAAVGTG